MIKIIKNRIFKIIVSTFILFITIFTSFCNVNTVRAYEVQSLNYDNTSIEDDFKSFFGNGPIVDFQGNIFNTGSDIDFSIVRLFEYGYTNMSYYEYKYGVYIYAFFKNDEYSGFSSDKQYSIIMSMHEVSYDDKPNLFKLYKLETLDYMTKDGGTYCKFKISGLNISNFRNVDDRMYNIYNFGTSIGSTFYGLNENSIFGYKFIYSGYGAGFYKNNSDEIVVESTLTSSGLDNYSIQLNVKDTFYRDGSNVKDIQNQINSVYFSLDNSIIKRFGKLQKIKASWYEFKTKNFLVAEASDENTSNDSEVYLPNLKQKDIYRTPYDFLSTVPKCVVDYDNLYSSILGNRDYLPYNYYYSNFSNLLVDKNDSFAVFSELSTQGGEFYALDYFGSGFPDSFLEWNFVVPSYEKIVSGNNQLTPTEVRDYLLTDVSTGTNSNGLVVYDSNENKNLFLSYDNVCDSLEDDNTRNKRLFNKGENIIQNGKTGKSVIEFDADDALQYSTETKEYNFWKSLFGGYDVNSTTNSIKPIYSLEATDFAGTSSDICDNLLIHKDDIEPLKEAVNDTTKTTYLFRFAVSDYFSRGLYFDYDYKLISDLLYSTSKRHRCYYAYENIFLDFKIITLTFTKGTKSQTIPVKMNSINIINGLTPGTDIDDFDEIEELKKWFSSFKESMKDVVKTILIILGVVLLVVVGTPIIRFVFNFISGIFKFIFKRRK